MSKTKAAKKGKKRSVKKTAAKPVSTFEPGTFLVKKSDAEIPVQCTNEAQLATLVATHGATNVRRVS